MFGSVNRRKVRYHRYFTSRVSEKLQNLCHPAPLDAENHLRRVESAGMLTHSVVDGQSCTDLTSDDCDEGERSDVRVESCKAKN